MIIEPEDMINAINNSTDFALENFNVNDSILTSEVVKIISSADILVLSPSDLVSLGILLSYKAIPETIKNSKGTVIVMIPMGSRFPINPYEIPLLEILKLKPDISSFIKLINEFSDIIVLDQADTEYIKVAQESGLITVVQDLINIEDPKEFVNTILTEGGINHNDVHWMTELSPISTNKTEDEEPVQKKRRTTIFNLASTEKMQMSQPVESKKKKQEKGKKQLTVDELKNEGSSTIPNKALDEKQLPMVQNKVLQNTQEKPKEDQVQTDKKEDENSSEDIIKAIAKIKENKSLDLDEWSISVTNIVKNDVTSTNILGKEILIMILDNFYND